MCSDYYSRKICWKSQKFLSSIHKLLLYRISRACGHQPVLTCPVQVSTLPCPGRRVFLEICPVSCPEQGRTQDRAGFALSCGHLWYVAYLDLCSHRYESTKVRLVPYLFLFSCFGPRQALSIVCVWAPFTESTKLYLCLTVR